MSRFETPPDLLGSLPATIAGVDVNGCLTKTLC